MTPRFMASQYAPPNGDGTVNEETGLPETLREWGTSWFRHFTSAALIGSDDEAFDAAFDTICSHADRPTYEDGETNIERAREWSYELLASLGRPYGCGKWGVE